MVKKKNKTKQKLDSRQYLFTLNIKTCHHKFARLNNSVDRHLKLRAREIK